MMNAVTKAEVIASFDKRVATSDRMKGPDYHDILRAVAHDMGLTLDAVRDAIRDDAAGTVGHG